MHFNRRNVWRHWNVSRHMSSEERFEEKGRRNHRGPGRIHRGTRTEKGWPFSQPDPSNPGPCDRDDTNSVPQSKHHPVFSRVPENRNGSGIQRRATFNFVSKGWNKVHWVRQSTTVSINQNPFLPEPVKKKVKDDWGAFEGRQSFWSRRKIWGRRQRRAVRSHVHSLSSAWLFLIWRWTDFSVFTEETHRSRVSIQSSLRSCCSAWEKR